MKSSKLLALMAVLIVAAIALFAYLAPKHHSVTLHWAASAGATSYNVYRGTTRGGPYDKVGTASAPTFVDTDVDSGKTFYYVVTAVKDGKESRHSAEIKAAVP